MGKKINAGAAMVKVYADNSALIRGLKGAQRRLRAFGGAVRGMGLKMMAAGAGLMAPLLAAVHQFMTAGDALDKMSGRVGASVEFLSALSHAAQLGGTDIDSLESGIKRLQRTAYDAERGLSTAVEAFQELGVEAKGADGRLKQTEQLFMESVTALSKMTDHTKKAALAQVIFGRAGTKLLPMLKDGAGGLSAMMEEARKLGLVMSTEDAQKAAVLTDSWTKLKNSLKMAGIQIGSALAPALTSLADKITQNIRPIIDWIKENGQLIVTALKVAAVVTGVGVAIVAVGAVISGVGAIFGALATAVSVAGTVLGVIGTVLGAICSPVGLVIAAVTAAAGAILYFSGAGGKAIDWLSEKFGWLKGVFTKTLGAIGSALAKGDIGLAARVLWSALKMIWQKGLAVLKRMWVKFKFTTAQVFTNTWAGIRKIWVESSAKVRTAWAKTINTVIGLWEKAKHLIAKGWTYIAEKIKGTSDAKIAEMMSQRDRTFHKEQREREEADEKEIASIASQREKQVRIIEDTRDAALLELDKESDKEAAQAERKFNEAKREWQKAVAEAQEKGVKGGKRKMPEEGTPEYYARVNSGLVPATVRGTFNAMAARSLGARGSEERIAKATEETAKNTRALLKKGMKSDAPTFVRAAVT